MRRRNDATERSRTSSALLAFTTVSRVRCFGTAVRVGLTAGVGRAAAPAPGRRPRDAAAEDFEAAAATSQGDAVRRREILSAWADSLAALGQHDRAFALPREALDQR